MIDFYEVTTPPDGGKLPVTLTEVKSHLRIETTDDDTLLTSMLVAAVDRLEKYTNRVFIERTITGKFEVLCVSKFEKFPFIELRRAPVQSVTSMEITSGGAQVAWTDFTLKEAAGFPRIMFENDTPTADDVTYPITVVFVAGYGGQEAVPEPIKTAIKQLVAFWYENRGDVEADGGEGIPLEVRIILGPFKVLATYG